MNTGLRYLIKAASLAEYVPGGRGLVSGLELFFAQMQGIGYMTSMAEEVNAAWKCIEGEAPVVFDVGANRGDWARTFLSRASAGAKVYLFEPAQENIRVLRGIRDERLTVVPYGVGATRQTAVLHGPVSGSPMSSLYLIERSHLGLSDSHQEEVQVITIDGFSQEHGITRIDFLKLDIEGHELAALRGACRCLEEGLIKACAFEFGECNVASRTYLQDFWYLFKQLNYRLHRIGPNGVLIPITHYSAHVEVLRHSNIIAVLAR
jgi:FkbM family methyltransferase